MSNEGKAFGAIMLFFITILSYTPLKDELVSVAGNATLTNAGVVILNSIFGLIWILLAAFWLGLAVMYATK
jgi:uncharacterized membrane protein YccF (DUF307 family)